MTYEVTVSEPEGRWNGSRKVKFVLMSNDRNEVSIEVIPDKSELGTSWIAIVPAADLAKALNDLDDFEAKYTPQRELVQVPTGIGAVVARPDRSISLTRVSKRTWNSRNGGTYQDSEVYTRLNRDEDPWQILSKGVEV